MRMIEAYREKPSEEYGAHTHTKTWKKQLKFWYHTDATHKIHAPVSSSLDDGVG